MDTCDICVLWLTNITQCNIKDHPCMACMWDALVLLLAMYRCLSETVLVLWICTPGIAAGSCGNPMLEFFHSEGTILHLIRFSRIYFPRRYKWEGVGIGLSKWEFRISWNVLHGPTLNHEGFYISILKARDRMGSRPANLPPMASLSLSPALNPLG